MKEEAAFGGVTVLIVGVLLALSLAFGVFYLKVLGGER